MQLTTLFIAALGLATSAAACKCKKVSNPGLYCGFCPQVTDGWKGRTDHAFSCGKDGACVDHGYSNPCKTYNNYDYQCAGRDKWSKREAEPEAEPEVRVEAREAEERRHVVEITA